jgi:hypothetical protein
MAFPSNTGTIPLTLEQTFSLIRSVAGTVKTNAQALKARSLAGVVPAPDVTSYCVGLANQRDQLAALAATTGLQAYVTEYYPAVDLAAAYSQMIAQVDATIAWIVANYPKAATNELRERTWGAGGKVVNNTFSTSDLAGFRAQLDLLIAQID